MRFNSKKYKELMAAQELTPEDICRKTGLDEKPFQRIMTNGFASEDAMERLASVAAVPVGELLLPDISGNIENAIEFLKDQDTYMVTFSQGRYISRIKKLAETHPEECKILAINKLPHEGETICAHIPTAWIKINPGLNLTDEQRDERRRRFCENVEYYRHENS